MKKKILKKIEKLDQVIQEKTRRPFRWFLFFGGLVIGFFWLGFVSMDRLITWGNSVWNFVRIHRVIPHVAVFLFVLVCLGSNRWIRGIVGRFGGWIKGKKVYFGAFVGGGLVLYLLVFIVPLYFIPEADDKQVEARKLVAQCLVASILSVGAVITFRRMIASERQADAALKQAETAQIQAETAQKQVAALEDGQITTRYTEAIKQLGDKNLTIRLGGIYALERIARDSLKREPEGPAQDYRTVVEVLATFIRENSKEAFEKQCKVHGGVTPEEVMVDEVNLEKIPPLRADIQAGLTVLVNLQKRDSKRITTIDLHGSFLIRAELPRADLTAANLRAVKFYGAVLNNAILKEADLCLADLRGAILEQANLEGIKLVSAQMRKTFIKRASPASWFSLKTHFLVFFDRG